MLAPTARAQSQSCLKSNFKVSKEYVPIKIYDLYVYIPEICNYKHIRPKRLTKQLVSLSWHTYIDCEQLVL